MNDIVEKFTSHLRSVIVRSLSLAEENRSSEVGVAHLFCSLATERGSLGAEILQKTKINLNEISKYFRNDKNLSPKKEPGAILEFGTEAKRILEKAVLAASLYDHSYVGTEHLLSAIANAEKSIVSFSVAENDLKLIKRELGNVLKTTSKFPDMTADFRDNNAKSTLTSTHDFKTKKSKTPALDFFTMDLNKPEAIAKMDPLLGREAELGRVIQILSRRTKNNPILLGDPGVGKTAIVEGLAKKISLGDVPDTLIGKRILTLDLALLISGTVYRGEFESRLKQVLDEARQNPDVIIFVDEVHMIVGAGAASGSLDAANILKPALARGEVRAIGATTAAEFKRHIETDAALERRFQPVYISEPNNDETIKILTGLKEKYEKYHSVRISSEAIAAAVEMAGRYIPEKYFPDKAIDLMDEAAAAKKISEKSGPSKEISEIKKKLIKINEEKELAVAEENFKKAIELKEAESDLRAQLKSAEAETKETKNFAEVSVADIARVASRITAIPEGDLLGKGDPIKSVESSLKKKIFGQDKIIESVVSLLSRAKAQLQHPSRPLASMLFLGPTGVGKTEFAKVLGESFFGSKKAITRIDMSEFREPFQMSKLIGAPAGYVGYREATKLTDLVKLRPYSLVLFDEVEKAHPDVLNLLLQILEEGEITDAVGRKINFRNTVIVLTSNIGTNLFKKSSLGFSDASAETAGNGRILEELKSIMKPEFINRLDQIQVFNELSEEAMERVVESALEELNVRVSKREIKLVLSPSARATLAKEALRKNEGARSVRRLIEEKIESVLAKTLLKNNPRPGTVFTIRSVKGSVELGNRW